MAEVFDVNGEPSLVEVWELLEKRRKPAAELIRSDIPLHKGLYGWFLGLEIIYVGTATGVDGLRRRIGNHLSPRYLESRREKLRPEDAFQLSCGVLLNGKPAVDKSVFRRSLGAEPWFTPWCGNGRLYSPKTFGGVGDICSRMCRTYCGCRGCAHSNAGTEA